MFLASSQNEVRLNLAKPQEGDESLQRKTKRVHKTTDTPSKDKPSKVLMSWWLPAIPLAF